MANTSGSTATSESYYKKHVDKLSKDNKQLKQRVELLEKENKDLKKALYDVSVRNDVLLHLIDSKPKAIDLDVYFHPMMVTPNSNTPIATTLTTTTTT